MRILFSRHGESQANILHIISNRDLPHRLTPAGVEQALALAEAVSGYNLMQVFSSPILRAQETAGIIAARFGLPLTVSPALREFDCGGMEGRGDEEAWAAHREVIAARGTGCWSASAGPGIIVRGQRGEILPAKG